MKELKKKPAQSQNAAVIDINIVHANTLQRKLYCTQDCTIIENDIFKSHLLASHPTNG